MTALTPNPAAEQSCAKSCAGRFPTRLSASHTSGKHVARSLPGERRRSSAMHRHYSREPLAVLAEASPSPPLSVIGRAELAVPSLQGVRRTQVLCSERARLQTHG
jgi:hypothetical protein